MLNNIHFIALHVLMCTMSSSAIQGCLVKFNAIQLLLIGSVEFAAPHIQQFNQFKLTLAMC